MFFSDQFSAVLRGGDADGSAGAGSELCGGVTAMGAVVDRIVQAVVRLADRQDAKPMVLFVYSVRRLILVRLSANVALGSNTPLVFRA